MGCLLWFVWEGEYVARVLCSCTGVVSVQLAFGNSPCFLPGQCFRRGLLVFVAVAVIANCFLSFFLPLPCDLASFCARCGKPGLGCCARAPVAAGSSFSPLNGKQGVCFEMFGP